MRGSPLLRVLLTLVGLLALLVPLHRLTSHPAHVLREPEVAVNSLTKVRLTLTSTTFPFTYEVSHLGKTIWKGDSVEPTASRDVTMGFPAEGVELLVDASWNDAKATAVKLEVTPQKGETLSRTLWGNNKVSDVLTFVSGK